MLAATALQAFHRSGQTFITWTEDGSVTGEKYNVYRSTTPITTANIGSAEKLTSKWGPLDDNTSLHPRRSPGIGIPATFMINDLGTPLSTEQGLFVYTTPTGQSGTWYYAVTQVTGGTENVVLTAGSNSLTTGVAESVATPSPILTVKNASGKGRIYTQYMDYAKWNPTFQGYAYNYSVALPDNYDPNVSWPMKLMPHAYGERLRMEPSAEFGWPCIEVFLDDPGGGAPGEHFQTWWYGFAADHNYQTQGSFPTAGHVENFTEQRVLKTIDEVSSAFNVDRLRIHSQGHSMGASGSLSLGMRYANVFSGIFGSEPMTNYASSPGFQYDFSVLWGSQALNLPIVNNGVYAGPLKKYDGMGVYNWMNHHEQLVNRRGEPMAFLMVGHGKADDVIDWATQGKPFIAALNAGNVGYSAEQRFGWDHNWMAFDFSLDTMFSPTDGGLSAWAYPRNVSFPGISNATGSGPSVPGTTGTDFYNMQFEWSVPWNHFHTDLVDTVTRYEISIRSNTVAQTANVTPQRRQAFNPLPGATVTWQNVNNVTGLVVQSGTLVVDADGLVTLPSVSIGTGVGNRFILTVPASGTARPGVTGPSSPSVDPAPTITWTGVPDAMDYDLLVRNISTGNSVTLRTSVTGLNYTPPEPWGIGQYKVQVRARYLSGAYSAWSDLRSLRITTPPVVDRVTTVSLTGRPLLTWGNVPGAVQYTLLLRNQQTGLDTTVTVNRMESNSYQFSNSLGIGSYYFYVRGVDAAGVSGQWSSPVLLRSAEATTLSAPTGTIFGTTPEFSWLPVFGANKYEVLVKLASSSVTVAQQDVSGTTWTPLTALPIASYRWWVRAKIDGVMNGAWSVPKVFSNSGIPVMLTQSGTTNDRTPTFNWTNVGGAASYSFRIVWTSTNAVVSDVTNLQQATYTIPNNLAPGQYRVWVRAVSAGGTLSNWSRETTITITALDSISREQLQALVSEISGYDPEVVDFIQHSTDTEAKATAVVAERVENYVRRDEASEQNPADDDQAIDIVMTEIAQG